MSRCMRPEKRFWGPSIDIRHAELVANLFRGITELCRTSVSIDDHDDTVRISIHGWPRLSRWLRTADASQTVRALLDEGWIDEAERVEACELLVRIAAQAEVWSDFTDPDSPDVLELLADY